MSIPSLKAIVGHAIITKDFPPDAEKQLPGELCDYLTVFRKNIIESPKLIFDNAHKVEVKSLDDKNPYENIRLELIKIRILNKSISTSKKSLNKLLIAAADNGNLETVKYLIEYGADIDARDFLGSTALVSAADHGHIKVVKYLIKYGADINAITVWGWTALLSSALNGHIEVVNHLIKKRAKINPKDEGNKALLLLSAVKNGLEIIQYLNINPKDDGDEALIVASQSGNLETVKYLIKYGANINVTNAFGWTPLIVATYQGNHKETAKYLLEIGADIHARDVLGRTALKLAAIQGNIEMVKFLIQNGANYTVSDIITAFKIAAEDNLKKSIQYLKEFVEQGALNKLAITIISIVGLLIFLLSFYRNLK